jgi:hypothetical protein
MTKERRGQLGGPRESNARHPKIGLKGLFIHFIDFRTGVKEYG